MGLLFLAPMIFLFILLMRLVMPLLVFGIIAFFLWSVMAGLGRTRRSRPRSWEESLRERYARGEIGRQQYMDILSDVLKERYIRGELTFDEFEDRLDLLLREPAGGVRRELGPGPWPRPFGPGSGRFSA